MVMPASNGNVDGQSFPDMVMSLIGGVVERILASPFRPSKYRQGFLLLTVDLNAPADETQARWIANVGEEEQLVLIRRHLDELKGGE